MTSANEQMMERAGRTAMGGMLQAVKDAHAKYKETIAAIGQNDFAEVAKQIFDQWPELQGFCWAQYTPYFNDGDSCEFGSTHTEPTPILMDRDSWAEGGDYPCEGWWSAALDMACADLGIPETDYKYSNPAHKLAKRGAEERLQEIFLPLTEIPEDVMEQLFGDHVSITCWRTGEVEVDDYEHE